MDTDILTEKIIGCAINVSNKLGVGFLESVYEKSLLIELRKCGLKAERQKPISVCYENQVVGEFFADIVVSDCVILELKVTKVIDDVHKAQLLNYLKATKIKVGLILNFGTPKLGVKRMVY